MSIELVMPSNHLILCHPLLLLPSIFPSIRVFSHVSSSHQVARVLEFPLQHQSFQCRWLYGWTLLFCDPMDLLKQQQKQLPLFFLVSFFSATASFLLTSFRAQGLICFFRRRTYFPCSLYLVLPDLGTASNHLINLENSS